MHSRNVAICSLLAVATASAFTPVPSDVDSMRKWTASTIAEARSNLGHSLHKSSRQAAGMSLMAAARKSSNMLSQRIRSLQISVAGGTAAFARRSAKPVLDAKQAVVAAHRRDSHELACDDISTDAENMFAKFADHEDAECILEDLDTTMKALANDADRTARLDKICSVSGAEATTTSCGSDSAMGMIKTMLSNYEDKDLPDDCMIMTPGDDDEEDEETPVDEFLMMGEFLSGYCDHKTADGDYCFLKIVGEGGFDDDDDEESKRRANHDGDKDDKDDPPTVAQLDIMCDAGCKPMVEMMMGMDDKESGKGDDDMNMDMMCAQDNDGNYCILKMEDMNEDSLDAMCSDSDPCAVMMMEAVKMGMQEDGGLPVSSEDMMEMICSKDGDGEYCMPQLEAMGAEEGSGGDDDGPSDAELEIMCGPCGQGMVSTIVGGMMEDMKSDRRGQHEKGPPTEEEMKMMMELGLVVMQSMCAKGTDGKYCMRKELPDLEKLREEGKQPTNAQMEDYCGSCGDAYFNMVMVGFKLMDSMGDDFDDRRGGHEGGPDPAMIAAMMIGGRNIECLKDGSKFCKLDEDADFLEDKVYKMDVDAAGAKLFCENRCLYKRANFELQFARDVMEDDGAGEILPMLASGCFKDGETYCLEKVFEDIEVGIAIDTDCDFTAATCSDACKTALQTTQDAWGCCTTEIAKSDEDLHAFAKDKCGITFTSCDGAGAIMFHIGVPNLKYSWFKPKMKDYMGMVSSDVGLALDLPPNLVKLSDVQDKGGGSKLMLSADVESANQAKQVLARIKGGARRAGLNVEFESLAASLPVDAMVDPAAGMTGEVDEETIEGEGSMATAIAEAEAPTSGAMPSAVPFALSSFLVLASLVASLAVY